MMMVGRSFLERSTVRGAFLLVPTLGTIKLRPPGPLVLKFGGQACLEATGPGLELQLRALLAMLGKAAQATLSSRAARVSQLIRNNLGLPGCTTQSATDCVNMVRHVVQPAGQLPALVHAAINPVEILRSSCHVSVRVLRTRG